MKDLGEKIKAERIRQRFSLKGAAKAASMARDTWKKVELGQSVHDTSRSAALELLGLDWSGEPVGPDTQDVPYVASPGERVEPRESDNAVLRAINAMRADVEKLVGLPAAVADLGRRLEAVERRTESLDSPESKT